MCGEATGGLYLLMEATSRAPGGSLRWRGDPELHTARDRGGAEARLRARDHPQGHPYLRTPSRALRSLGADCEGRGKSDQ